MYWLSSSDNYDTVSLLINNKLFFYLISENDQKFHEFPPELQVNEKIYDVEIDKFEKCIYAHVKKGIRRKCYSSRNEIDKKYELFVHDSNILAIELDTRTNHLYYHNKHLITLLHTRFFTRMTIYRTDNLIYYVKLDLNTDQLYVSYIKKTTGKIMVLIMTTSGGQIKSFMIEEKVKEMSYFDNSYHIYTESKFMKVDSHGKLKYLKRKLPTTIKLIDYETNDIFFTSSGIKLSSYLFFGNLKKSNYEPTTKSSMSLNDLIFCQQNTDI
ncbi:hypothetical protein RF11_15841 [Thelohanellus kitauei]|uniref:Uncharacterized protein n=1 Tax=Thelohanellus kitauei TaxID=669202 RepID=A0A0C2IY39_THEKT|nr:hypothetical protein RF11_15841 [Thelohanellus kitauei]